MNFSGCKTIVGRLFNSFQSITQRDLLQALINIWSEVSGNTWDYWVHKWKFTKFKSYVYWLTSSLMFLYTLGVNTYDESLVNNMFICSNFTLMSTVISRIIPPLCFHMHDLLCIWEFDLNHDLVITCSKPLCHNSGLMQTVKKILLANVWLLGISNQPAGRGMMHSIDTWA